MADISLFVAATIPVMILLGIRHALDVDHIAAIDNLVRMRNAIKSARWIGSLFSVGHMLAVCAEMVALIYIVKSLEAQATFQLLGGILGASVLALIGGINLYSLRRYGRSGFGMLAQRMAETTRFAGNVGSPLMIGFVFGLGFDTATQISALTVAAVASATQGVQVALLLAAFFATGMIPTDTLDSLVLREVFSRMTNSGGFKTMSYVLSVLAMSLAILEATGVVAGIDLIPSWSGAILALSVISAGFSYSYYTRTKENPKVLVHHVIPTDE
jgi:nickel/cobalt transporter (NiCoT) family protein